MALPIRAIYKQGQLQLLEPINLSDGEEVEIMIVSEKDHHNEAFTNLLDDEQRYHLDKEASLEALKDLLVRPSPPTEDFPIDEETLMQEIADAFRGQPPLSDDIIRERQEGP
jgi:predicted DNA-binding antitoxin AbrB/MazE fold protein